MTVHSPSGFGSGPDRRPYYAQGEAWAGDVLGALRRSRRTAWVLAGVAVGAAVLNGVALSSLSPITRIVPYAVQVDRQADFARSSQPLAKGSLQSDPAVIQAYAVRYVQAREGYRPAQILDDYRLTTLLSGSEQRAVYTQGVVKTGATSPLNLYPATARVEIRIRSASLLDAKTVLVRYDAVRADLTNSPSEPSAAYVSFSFSNAPMTNADRFLNPLGFQVTGYRTQPDAG